MVLLCEVGWMMGHIRCIYCCGDVYTISVRYTISVCVQDVPEAGALGSPLLAQPERQQRV